MTRWINRGKMSKFKKQVYSAVLVATVYQIWRVHNDALWNHALWNHKLERPEESLHVIKDSVKIRTTSKR